MAAPRKYPLELKERALRLWRAEQPRRPIAHVARELGIHPEAMRTWIRQDEADRGERNDRLTSEQLEELRRLRKENAELRRTNEMGERVPGVGKDCAQGCLAGGAVIRMVPMEPAPAPLRTPGEYRAGCTWRISRVRSRRSA
jgi:transposase